MSRVIRAAASAFSRSFALRHFSACFLSSTSGHAFVELLAW
jgi:hypothetical protein